MKAYILKFPLQYLVILKDHIAISIFVYINNIENLHRNFIIRSLPLIVVFQPRDFALYNITKGLISSSKIQNVVSQVNLNRICKENVYFVFTTPVVQFQWQLMNTHVCSKLFIQHNTLSKDAYMYIDKPSYVLAVVQLAVVNLNNHIFQH